MTKNSKRIEDRLKERLNVLNQDESNFGCSLGQQSQVKGPLTTQCNSSSHFGEKATPENDRGSTIREFFFQVQYQKNEQKDNYKRKVTGRQE